MKNNPFTIQEGRKKFVIKHYASSQWMGDSVPQADEESRETLSVQVSARNVRWLLAVIAIFLAALIVRAFYLQVAQGEEFRVAAEENRIRNKIIPSMRGIIIDRTGAPLVANSPNFILSATPADLPEGDERIRLIKILAPLIQMSEEELGNIFANLPKYSYEPVIIKEQIPYEQALLLTVESKKLGGIDLEMTSVRSYQEPGSFSHVLGYVGKISKEEYEEKLKEQYPYLMNDTIGKTGLESFYESELRGVYGRKQIEVDSLGKEVKIVTETDGQPGHNIVTTIDKGLQEYLGAIIEQTVKRSSQISGAAAVALDPRSGEVLALISAPSYDNNALAQGLTPPAFAELTGDPKKPLFNRAVAGEYPSGSTIKPLIALSALEDGIITERTTFTSTGGIHIGPWFFPDWKAGGHGVTDVRKGIADSVNTFFYMIGGGDEQFRGLGIEKIRSYLELFGLNGLLGIDLPGESPGFLPSQEWKESVKNERWYIGDTYHLSIGQGDLLVTPLQVATYTATIANGGTFYKPHFLHAITDEQGNVLKTTEPTLVRANFLSEHNVQIVQEGMRQAVTDGSSRAMQDLPITSAGKTGTAEWADSKPPHAWFTAYAPYEHPEIVITVLVESGGEGHATALPIAKDALRWWFSQRKSG